MSNDIELWGFSSCPLFDEPWPARRRGSHARLMVFSRRPACRDVPRGVPSVRRTNYLEALLTCRDRILLWWQANVGKQKSQSFHVDSASSPIGNYTTSRQAKGDKLTGSAGQLAGIPAPSSNMVVVVLVIEA